MRLPRPVVVLLLGLSALAARAQSTAPVVEQTIPEQSLVVGGQARTLDLRNHIKVPGVSDEVAQFDTVFGKFLVELLPGSAPQHVTNFKRYVSANSYANSFFHRSATFDGGANAIVQGGGYRSGGGSNVTVIPTFSAVPLEANLPNARGTLAAARSSDVNSATSQWFFNTRDNSTTLGAATGGYSVFGRVLGSGMTIVDRIADLPHYVGTSPFNELPVRDYTAGSTPTEANLIIVSSVRMLTKLPEGGASIVTLTVQNSAPAVVSHTLSASNLTLTPLAAGEATIAVRATDVEGTSVEATFVVRVTAGAPVFTLQPASQNAAAGSTVVFNARATAATRYQWRLYNSDIPGANSSALVLNNVTGANAGDYSVVADNSFGTVISRVATLTVANTSGADAGRLINLSILTAAGAGSNTLTVGAVVGPIGSASTLPLVVRAVGPGLAVVGVSSGFLADPQMALFASSNPDTPLATNDNWGGGADLSAAFASVGAFALPADSLDAAIVRPAPGVSTGGYTVQVSGKGSASGLVLAEIYDASATARTATLPRLINVSVLKQLEAGGSMTAGFVIGGQTARTVLIRAIGPGLSNVGVTSGFLADPQLELYNASSVKIADNDNWGGENHLSIAAASVGAFAVRSSSSADAMLLVTLAPGNYTARVAGAGNGGGNVIVEVYEVP